MGKMRKFALENILIAEKVINQYLILNIFNTSALNS